MSERDWLRISEIFESIQGEGASAGAPAVFLRLAVCNLRCTWCDTRYTWDWSAYRYDDEVKRVSVDDIVARVTSREPTHLVVTGGEPLLQQPALERLFSALPASRYVEIETNGTLTPSPELARRVDQWNVSPKLANSGEPLQRRISTGALAELLATGRAWLKLVVEKDDDAAEAEALMNELGWPREQVLFMPQASTPETLVERSQLVQRLARDARVAMSPRLHVERWGGRRGV